MTVEELLRLERSYDENLTFQPVINKPLPHFDGSSDRENPRFLDVVRLSQHSSSALRKPRSLFREDPRASLLSSSIDSDSGFKKSTSLKASEKILCEKLEKELKKAISEVLKVDY